MLTGWLWIHSPDRHRGVDVVNSNRSLVLESTSSVVNERLLIPQVHQHKKRKNHTDDRREQLRRGSEDRPCTHSPARRSIDVVDVSCWSIPRFQASFIRQLNSSEIYVFCSFEWSPCIVPGNRKKVHWGEEESLNFSRDLGYRPWRRVAKKSVGRSKWLCMMRMRHDAMSGCAG